LATISSQTGRKLRETLFLEKLSKITKKGDNMKMMGQRQSPPTQATLQNGIGNHRERLEQFKIKTDVVTAMLSGQ